MRSDFLFRLHDDAEMAAVVRLVGYAGIWEQTLQEQLPALDAEHGERKVRLAIAELTATDGEGFVTLRPHVRAMCCQLLGPPPERWDTFYRHPDGTPRARPPGRERPPEKPPKPGATPKKKRSKAGKG